MQVFIYLLFTYTVDTHTQGIRKLKCCFISNHDLQFNTFSNKVKLGEEKKIQITKRNKLEFFISTPCGGEPISKPKRKNWKNKKNEEKKKHEHQTD